MRFVALDLETTWLSPQTDTIIEVAAVRFTLTRGDSGRYEASDIEEHSQLVNPGRPMTEEISMITGITDDMLADRPMWADIREKVREFIGSESVIVGHNVLFDVAMFATHDIDLSSHPILDTFELSEILSQEAESLNLGFLAGMYGLSAGDKEHRALGDTRLSVGLFVHYLNQIETLSEEKKNIFALAKKKEKKPNLGFFAEIAGILVENKQNFSLGVPVILTKEESALGLNHTWEDASYLSMTDTSKTKAPTSYFATSLPYGRDAERVFLEKNIAKWVRTDIAVFGYNQALSMQELLGELGFSASFWRSESEFCSLVELRDRIEASSWGRKEAVLIVKLLYWLEETETGLLSELKLYGEEREEISYFRMQIGEENRYHRTLQEQLTGVDCVIYDMTKHLQSLSTSSEHGSWATVPPGWQKPRTEDHLRSHISSSLILKDVPLLEEAMRRSLSIYISMDDLIATLEQYRDTTDIVSALRWIESLYISFPDRPTGPNVSPPGDYGETYFLPQSEIWHRGYQTLSLTNQSLTDAYILWRDSRLTHSRQDTIRYAKIDIALQTLNRFHTISCNDGVIITIIKNTLRLSYIPREVHGDIRDLLWRWDQSALYGTHIDGERVARFLEHEAGIQIDRENSMSPWSDDPAISVDAAAILQLQKNWDIWGTVILTTSMKWVREIGRSLESTGKRILMQGISGGKGKQLAIFIANPDTSIIVGTIDMWRDELNLWKSARHIVIAKLPFDPPTDPYFLARTVGMANNFALYSEPMTIIKMSTLISRIRSTAYAGDIICEDTRLVDTLWGQALRGEIV